MKTRNIFVPHADLLVPRDSMRPALADTGHNPRGAARIKEMVGFIVRKIQRDSQPWVGVLIEGECTKYDQVFAAFYEALCEAGIPPTLLRWDPILGVPMSMRTQLGHGISSTGRIFPKANCGSLTDHITPEKGWEFVQRTDELTGGWKIYCGGRQYLSILDCREDFEMAIACYLDWVKKEVRRLPWKWVPKSA